MRSPRHALAPLAIIAAIAPSACASIPKGRAAIDSVEIIGTTAVAPDETAAKLATSASPKFFGLFRGFVDDYSIYDASTLQRDLARVERYYRGRGFFEAHARVARVIHLSSDHVKIQIVVDEGAPVENGAVVIDGTDGLPPATVAGVRAAAERVLPRGKRFDEETYQTAQVAVLSALTEQGYAYAKGESDARVDLATHTIAYTFALHPGIPTVYGPITFTGLDPDGAGPRPQEIASGPLLRAMHMREGKSYSTATIEAATQALLDLGVFSSAHVVPKLADPPNPVVPLEVQVEPAKLRTFQIGGGGEFDEIKTDVHLLLGWEDHNFLGDLRSFSVDWRPGLALYPTSLTDLKAPTDYFPEEHLRLQFRQPGFIEARTDGFIQPELNVYPLLVEAQASPDEAVVGYVEPRLAIGVDRRFGKHFFAKLLYNLQGELPFAYKGHSEDRPTVLLSFPQIIAQLDFRDDAVHPHAGLAADADLQACGGPFGGTATDLRAVEDVAAYVPIARGVTFAVSGTFGVLFPLDYGASVQRPELDQATNSDIQTVYFRGYFSGGPSSNRGYPARGVGPHGFVGFLNPVTAAAVVAQNCFANGVFVNTPECESPVGGFTQWEVSAELRFQVSGPLGAALFCDAGDVSQYVFPHPGSLRLDYLHMSCGGGGRYDTPVGPIRLDIGVRIPGLQIVGKDPSSDPTFGSPTAILGLPLAIAFGIGEAF